MRVVLRGEGTLRRMRVALRERKSAPPTAPAPAFAGVTSGSGNDERGW